MKKQKKPGWKEIPEGGLITEAGNARAYKTGGWRIKKPLWSEKKCIHCLLCWAYCPDVAFFVEKGKLKDINYDHCKGCGICANQCPAKALEMIAEDEKDKKEKVQDDVD